jgi:Putative addiction module component
MNQRVKALVDEARKLTPEEQWDLLRQLQTVINEDDETADGTPEEIEAAWMEEVGRRIDEAERGEGKTHSSEEVVAAARARIAAAMKAKA